METKKDGYQGLGGRENRELLFSGYRGLILQDAKVLEICEFS